MLFPVLVCLTIGCGEATNPQPSKRDGEAISLELRDVSVTLAVAAIVGSTEENVVVEEGLDRKITVVLDRVPWDQALEQLLKARHLRVERNGEIWHIRSAASSRRP